MHAERTPRRSWIASDRPVARLFARPVREFLQTEVSGGVVLLVAAALAVVWANSPWGDAYERVWHTELALQLGPWRLAEDLRHWVNDGLMALFFFVVGLEVRRELSLGELSSPRRAAFPSVAALGGMVVPALVYTALNFGGPGAHGWGIPMATDIAFALGVLALFGERVHPSLKVFLLSLAVADDIGAIVVIALFYSSGVEAAALAMAALLLAVIVALQRVRVVWTPVYAVLGVGVWLATYVSGVHATIAGVALGLVTPVRPLVDDDASPDPGAEPYSPEWFRRIKLLALERVSPCERLEHLLHPWTSFVVVPVFALANAGVRLNLSELGAAARSPVTLGVLLGLVCGKLAGIFSFAWLADRLGFAEVPEGVSWGELAGVAALAGIGFTVSLFITELAFDDPDLLADAKVGIMAASVASALLGALLLRTGRRVPEASSAPVPAGQDGP